MALLKTQNQLKKEYKAIIDELKMAVRLKCADCLGYFVDEYQPCSDDVCPLRKFYPNRKMAKDCRWFREEMVNLSKERGNDPSFVAEIGKLEPKNSPAGL